MKLFYYVCIFFKNHIYKMSTTDFINKAKLKHGDKYNYSKTNYTNSKTKIIIICKMHGEFEQNPHDHLEGSGCKQCGYISASDSKKSSTSEFIEKAKLVHDDKYDYSYVEYAGKAIKIKINCKEHGIFEQNPNNHLGGSGCAECSKEKIKEKYKKEYKKKFTEKANIKHNNKYDYSKTNYINCYTKIIIICKTHGEFKQIPSSHLSGSGCNKCGMEMIVSKLKSSTSEFIEKAKLVHDDLYDYSHVEYVGKAIKIKINCRAHGEFEQTPNDHLMGSGCSKCINARHYSKPQMKWLDLLEKQLNINIEHILNTGEHKIKNSLCKADGYSKEYNTVFEFHGCFFHGCEKCYPNRNEINKLLKKSYKELYNTTQKKKNHCITEGYKYIEIWECHWNNIKKTNNELAHYLDNIKQDLIVNKSKKKSKKHKN